MILERVHAANELDMDVVFYVSHVKTRVFNRANPLYRCKGAYMQYVLRNILHRFLYYILVTPHGDCNITRNSSSVKSPLRCCWIPILSYASTILIHVSSMVGYASPIFSYASPILIYASHILSYIFLTHSYLLLTHIGILCKKVYHSMVYNLKF